MRAAILTNNGFAVRDTGIPEPGPGEVRVRSVSNGICEGDVFRFSSVKNGSENPGDGILLGHEGSGIIDAVGSNVSGLLPGMRVTALGGGYADYFLADASGIVAVPGTLPVEHALGEPVACCVHAAERFGIRVGDRVAVIGAGFMGLMCMQLAKLQGAAHTSVFDIIPWRLSAAKELGADAVLNASQYHPSTDYNSNIVARELGEFDVVIEATGVESAVTLGTDLVRQHGTLVLVGYHQSNNGMRSVNMKTWNFKAITVVNGHVRRREEKHQAMARAMALLASKRLSYGPLITNYRFEDIGNAFGDLTSRKEGLFKANLVYS